MRSSIRLFALSLLLAPPALAGEGYLETTSGATVELAGYHLRAGEIDGSRYYPIAINMVVLLYDEDGPDDDVTLAPGNPEMQNLLRNVTVAMGLWENVPSTRLDFGISGFTFSYRPFRRDGSNVASLAGGRYGYMGQGAPFLARDGAGRPEIVEFDTLLSRGDSSNDPAEGQATMAQEIGHGIGFNHSWLNDDVVLDLTGAWSPPSVMSYTGALAPVARAGALNPDDVALVSRVYPDVAWPLSWTTGSVRGLALDAAGSRELYGAQVFLVDASTGAAIVGRLSGYATSRPNGTKGGSFLLDGVPPGTYDLLMAAKDDATLVRGGAPIDWLRLESSGATSFVGAEAAFDAGFPQAWVRGIRVRAGEIVDLGYVLAGVDRDASAPGLVDVTAYVPGDPGNGLYLYEVRSPSGRLLQSPVLTTPSWSIRVAPGRYAIRIWRSTIDRWYLVQDWTFVDWNARPLSATWSRAVRTVIRWFPIAPGVWIPLPYLAEPLEYVVDLGRPGRPGLARVAGHGTRYTTWQVPGSYYFRVLAAWNTSDPIALVRDWSWLTVAGASTTTGAALAE